MPKIIIHSLIFSPDGVSTAYLYNDIALRFRDEGYDVVVVTTTPHFNKVHEALEQQPLKPRAFGVFYESNFQGIRVQHVPQRKFSSTLLRIVGFIYWHVVSFFLILAERKVDVILSPSPPLSIGLVNIVLAKLKGCKVVYNVQEIYPDLLIESKGLRSSVLIALLKWVERMVYRHSDAVATIDQMFYQTIEPRFADPSRLHIIPNFVDTSLYRQLQPDELLAGTNIFEDTTALKVMYAGNIGHAQDWQTFVEVADAVRDRNIRFYVIGEGVEKNDLESQIARRKLTNVFLLPYQPRETIPGLLSWSDVQFIFMHPSTEAHGFPSKVYTIMACARPLLVSSGEGTPIVHFLEGKQCAKVVTVGDAQERVEQLTGILANTPIEEWRSAGHHGHRYIEENYTKEKVTGQYVQLVEKVIGKQ